MNSMAVPEDFRDIITKILTYDDFTYHIIWKTHEGGCISLGKTFLPENVSDPLEYICENNLVAEQNIAAFNVFCSRIQEGVLYGIDQNSLSLDLKIKFSPEEEFVTHHFYAHFLLGEDKIINAVHFHIRPFSVREKLDKQVLEVFTSDKAPQLFSKRCKDMLDRHPNEKVAFIQLDVERFKLINEKYGVEVGDELLKFMNDGLGLICNEDTPFCRLTADVFMVVVKFDTEEDLLGFIHYIESMLTGYKGMEYRLVFGIAIAEDRTLHTRRHGDNAAIARRSIHGNALCNIGWFNGKMKSDLHKMQSIEDDMYKALVNQEFVMYLQPKHSISTGRIIGAEALARWIHPQKGMIAPADFIPVFEKNGFILKLDQFIWESACREIRRLLDNGMEVVPISVNISREYVRSFDCVSYILKLIKKYDIPINLLELEITETVDSNGIQDVVAKMKQAGFTMLMDDFGSGYSSLNMLKTTQFDVLKIDREFLSEFMDSDRGRKIIEHTISMSQDIGLDIIAEGVETKEQAQFLKECGCDAAQGFFYSKPVSTSEFEERLVSVNGASKNA